MNRTFTLQLVPRGRLVLSDNRDRVIPNSLPGDVHLVHHDPTGDCPVWQWVDSCTGRLLKGQFVTHKFASRPRWRREAQNEARVRHSQGQ